MKCSVKGATEKLSYLVYSWGLFMVYSFTGHQRFISDQCDRQQSCSVPSKPTHYGQMLYAGNELRGGSRWSRGSVWMPLSQRKVMWLKCSVFHQGRGCIWETCWKDVNESFLICWIHPSINRKTLSCVCASAAHTQNTQNTHTHTHTSH